jgi:hypothetical protein
MAYQMNNYLPPNYIKPFNPNSRNSSPNSTKWTIGRLYFWIFVFGGLVGYRWYSGYQYNHSSYH